MGSYSRDEIVRRQLGVATQLFVDDLDPISVHSLINAAAENASLLAREAGKSTFNDHILSVFPDRKLNDIRKLRNKFWVPIKHAEDPKNNIFDLLDALEGFDDSVNDHALYIVWHDYHAAGFPLPIEAQVFQVWYYGLYPQKLAEEKAVSRSQEIFGSLTSLSRFEQKQRLKLFVENIRGNLEIARDPKTDFRPLILPSK